MSSAFHRRLRLPSGPAVSVVVHGLLVALLLVLARRPVFETLPVHLPGTLTGRHVLLAYTTGAPAAAATNRVPRRTKVPLRTPQPAVEKPAPVPVPPAAAPPADGGTGTTAEAAFGDDNVRIALPQVHPRPAPDLSSLPHGAGGDVIVDVVIDDAGKVTSTTLVRGLGGSIDTQVMKVLKDWTFTPATRNGQNIASEQEIVVHYDHG